MTAGAAPRILYLQHANPAAYPPIEHGARILARAGWRVRLLGAHAAGVERLEMHTDPGIEVRMLPPVRSGWGQRLRYLRFCGAALGHALLWRPGWIYASDPAAAPVALALSFVPGTGVVYHEHDSPAGAPAGAFDRLCRAARRRLAHRAALVVLPNEARARRFCEETGTARPVRAAWNCPLAEEAAQANRAPAGRLRVLYHGSIVPARLPLSVVHALARLPETVELVVAGYETVGSRGYVARLREEAARLGAERRVRFVGAVPRRRDLLDLARSCSVGLALMPMRTEDPNEAAMAGASNKAFDYLACGAAVVVSDRPEWRALFVEPGYGRACDPDDAGDVARVLEGFLRDPETARAMGEAGRRRILEEWNYLRVFGAAAGSVLGFGRARGADPGTIPASGGEAVPG